MLQAYPMLCLDATSEANLSLRWALGKELNKALFEVDDEEVEAEAKKQEIGESLSDSSIEQILEELKSRGFSTVNLSYS